MAPVRISVVEDPETLWPRRSEWNGLVARSATSTVFQTLEWQLSWWRAFGRGAQCLLLLAEADGELVGAAPLMLTRQRILGRSCRVVEFLGTHAADYSDFIADAARPEVVPLLLDWLAAQAGRWDLLHLINIAETSPLREALPKALGPLGYALEVKRLYECPTRVFGDRLADEQVTRKKSMREHLRKLSRQGEVRFEVHAEAAEIERRLDAFFDQHVARWAPTPTPSFFHDERQRVFYRELVRLLAPNAWVVFSLVLLGERPLSGHFGFEFDGRIYVIKLTYDPDYRQYAPGMLQVKYLLEYAMQRGARELDFTTGEEPYKYRFTNHVRVNYAARAHAPLMFYGVDRLVRRAKAAAARSPAVTRLAKRVLKPWLGETLRRLGM